MTKEAARAAVLDVGCFSAHLVVVDRDPRSLSRPLLSHKVRLRLDRATDENGRIDESGIDRIADAVAEVRERLDTAKVTTFLPFATSSVRDAVNADQVIARVARRTGITLRFLSGEREARLSYLAARHWFGARRPLAVLDVGGGTVELAVGNAPNPLFACSLPLGARTLTRAGIDRGARLTEVRNELVERITSAVPDDVLAEFARQPAVGCSKVFQQLARLTGDSPRRLAVDDLGAWIPRLAALPARERARLPGISRHRARQSLAGAVVAEALMRATDHDVIDICPWSTKEGLLLNLLRKAG